jgi:hypothetical protein
MRANEGGEAKASTFHLDAQRVRVLIGELLSWKLWCLVVQGAESFNVGRRPYRGLGSSL